MNGLNQELIDLGLEESQDLIARLKGGLTILEDDTEEIDFEARVKELRRYSHTLKGVSRTIGLTDVEEIAGRLESFFKEMKDARSSRRIEDTMFSERVEVLLTQLDEIIRDIERNQL